MTPYSPSLFNTLGSLLRIATRSYPAPSLREQANLLITTIRQGGLLLTMDDIRVKPHHLKNYGKVCGIETFEYLPPLYPQVLMGPLQLSLLAGTSFPINMIGAVHKGNIVRQYRPIGPSDELCLELSVSNCRILTNGVELELLQTVKIRSALAWTSLSTFFIKDKSVLDKPKIIQADLPNRIEEMELKHIAKWKLENNLGRQYAFLTGDFNPIHVSRLFAQAQRFEHAIAHGFCVVATGYEKLLRSGISSTLKQNEWELNIAFKGPNYLGKEMSLYTDQSLENENLLWFCDQNPRPTIQAYIGK